MGLSAKLSAFRPSPVTLAVGLTVILILWLIVGDKKQALDDAPERSDETSQPLSRVEVRWLEPSPYSGEVVVQGQVEPWQGVSVKAQVTGRVDELLKQQGDAVEKGDVLLRLTDEGRAEMLARARATLRLRKTELDSALTLSQSKFVTETEIQRLRSELALAEAELRTAELAVEYNTPEAPFDALIARRYVDIGELVSAGTDLMDLVDIARLKVTGYVPQQKVSQLEVGQTVTVDLLDGRQLEGQVLFISPSAESETRSFYIEVAADNPNLWKVAGASATAHIHLPPVQAHTVAPSLLSLNEQGRLGVHVVDEQNQVDFRPVEVVAVNEEEAVLQGLSDRVRVITLGAGFVEPGQTVRPVESAQ